VETEIEDFNKVGCLSNLMKKKCKDSNKWVAPILNNIFASKDWTIRICWGADVLPHLLYLAFLNYTIEASSLLSFTLIVPKKNVNLTGCFLTINHTN
jgi:hypothetical protein